MVDEPVIYPIYRSDSWSEAWTSTQFRRKAIVAGILFTAILIFLPHFFSAMEARQGAVLNDWFVNMIPARDCSVTICIFLWSASGLLIFRCIQQPAIYLMAIYLIIA